MKKLLSATVATTILLTGCSTSANPAKVNATEVKYNYIYGDVSEITPGYNAINRMKKLGILDTVSGNKFMPTANVKRIDAIKLLVKARKIDVKSELINDVDVLDVPKTHKDYPYLKAAIAYKIVPATSKFNPDGTVKRVDMATWIVNAFELKGSYPYNFNDVTSNNNGYEAIKTLAANEVDFGYSGNMFKPNNVVKRVDLVINVDKLLSGLSLQKKYITYADHTSKDTYKITNGTIQMLPTEKKTNNGYASTTFNPNLNSNLYNLVKTLLSEDRFTSVRYYNEPSIKTSGYFVDSSLGQPFSNRSNYSFRYDFFENRTFDYRVVDKKLSNKVYMTLSVGDLFDDINKVDNKKEISNSKLKKQLKASVLTVFGATDGTKIYNLIMTEYVKYQMGYPDGRISTKTIGKNRVDIHWTDKLTLYFSKK